MIPKQQATILSRPKFIGDKKPSNPNNTIYSTINSSVTTTTKNNVRSQSHPPKKSQQKKAQKLDKQE